MAVEFGDAQLVKMLDQRQEARLVGRHVGVGRAEQERLIAFVAATVDQVGGFGVGAGDDDAGNPHDVELEAGGVQSLDLLVLRAPAPCRPDGRTSWCPDAGPRCGSPARRPRRSGGSGCARVDRRRGRCRRRR